MHPSSSAHIFAHESLVEIRPQHVVDEFLLLFVLRASGLVLEYDIIVPPSLEIEVLGIE